ncbi:hypothetical protein V2G26_005225 [Clonostachys chloroleuca]
MEVVGVIASSVTLLEVSLKTVGFFQEMATVQDDFRCLQEVVADIDSIIQAFHSIPSLFAQGSGLPQVAEPILIARAISQLEHLKNEMDEIITNCARSSDSDGSSKAKKRRWILIRNRIPKLLERARDARSNFQTGIKLQSMALDAIRGAREHREYLEVRALVQELRSIQQLSRSDEQGDLEEHQAGKEDEDEVEDSSEEITRHSNSTAPSIHGMDVIGAEQPYLIYHAETAVAVRTQSAVSQFHAQRSSRIGPMESQPCRCQTKWHWNRCQAPVWLRPIIGTWVVHHSPGQDSTRPRSSNCRCHATESLCLNVEGLLPAWTRARTLLRVAFNSSGLALSLRPARVIDFSDVVYDWAVVGTRSGSFWMPREWIYFPEDHTPSGEGIMEVAIRNGQFAVVEFLLAKWQNILQHRKLRREVAFEVYEQLTYLRPKDQDAQVLKRVLSFVEDAPVWGESTLVHAAARRGHGIKEALDKEPWALNGFDYNGESPIHVASKRGNINAVEDLIQANASVNMKDFMGYTALMLATFNDHVDCVRLLLRRSDINIDQRDDHGNTALCYAARTCDPEVVAALLAEGASVSVRNIAGDSPLHFLGDNCTNHERIKQTLQLLLASGKTNIDVADDAGASPLMQAIISNRVASLWCLVEAGASMQLLNKSGSNVLHMAAWSNLDVMQYLLSLDPTMFWGISPSQPGAWLHTPWRVFQGTLLPSSLDYREESSQEASKAAFNQLLQIAQDESLRWEITILEFTLAQVRQSQVNEARSQLNSVVVQREKWKDDESVCYYRGISQQIQAGDFEGVITALEEDIEDLHGQIGSSPWLEDSDFSLPDSSDIASSDEEDDQTDGGEDGDGAYETAESGDEVENEDTGTAL